MRSQNRYFKTCLNYANVMLLHLIVFFIMFPVRLGFSLVKKLI